eukprot:GEMP01002522.1.p1 GENE.GEMP01002522.1~~GEMP01002522.1.p1  ORF type:complete len:906 (+),score=147.99 GEMP01002522.1:67-2784(+)
MYGIHPSVALEYVSSGTCLDKRVRRSAWNFWGRIVPNSRKRRRFYWIDSAGANLKWTSRIKNAQEARVPIYRMQSIGFSKGRRSFVVHLNDNTKIKLRARTSAQMKLWVTALVTAHSLQKPSLVQEGDWRDFDDWINGLDEIVVNKLLRGMCEGTQQSEWRRNASQRILDALRRRSSVISRFSTDSRQIGHLSRLSICHDAPVPFDDNIDEAENRRYPFDTTDSSEDIILTLNRGERQLHPIVAGIQTGSPLTSGRRKTGQDQISALDFARLLRATTPQPIVALFLSLIDCAEVNSEGASVSFYDCQHDMCVVFCGRLNEDYHCQPMGLQCVACREVQIQGESELLSVEQYAKLQGIPLSEARRHLADFSDGTQEYLSLETFAMLMQSQRNSITNLYLHDDMSRPLSEYFIATSHNTYLEGDQLTGESTVKQYIDVLTRRVCRCIEIDLWDGDKEPIVTHGHTMCGKIAFEEVIRAVKKFGFTSSPYPIVLSIEQHCSTKNIEKQGQIMAEVLGSALVVFDETIQKCVSLLSPEELKHKVLVKAKVQKLDVFDRCIALRGSKHSSADLLHILAKVQEDESGSSWSRRPYNIASYSEKKMISFMKKAFVSESTNSLSMDTKEKPTCLSVVRKWVSDHFSSGALGEGRQYLRPSKRYQLSSTEIQLQNSGSSLYSNPKGLDKKNSSISFMAQRDAFDNSEVYLLRTYHTHFISRIYPKGTRVRSTNFHPWLSWHVGCQMAAMNYQTLDEPMILNEGLFRSTNARTGYVLKEVITEDMQCARLAVKIVCGSFLFPYHQRPLFVRCSLSMDPRQNCSFVTEHVVDKMNPVWNHSHIFDINPRWWGESHHVLTFEVFSHERKHGTNIRILYNAVPLRFLSFGTFRWIELYDEDTVKHCRSGLFVTVCALK